MLAFPPKSDTKFSIIFCITSIYKISHKNDDDYVNDNTLLDTYLVNY